MSIYVPPKEGVPTLRQLCIDLLVKVKDLLGDLGYVDVASLRELLSHVTKEQLAAIEDATK